MGVKVLSLFDGMSCGAVAFRKMGVEVNRYVAYEIDKYALKVSAHNFPDIEQRGNVFEADFTEFDGFDYIVGGSPCTYWSIAQKNNRETEASGLGWELFSQYVRAVHEAKPKYFLYENNKSMSKEIRASIDEAFGFEAVGINSALVSAQNRQRLYWVGRRNADGAYSKVDVKQPEDRGILLRDVLDGAYPYKQTETEKGYCLDANYWKTLGSPETFLKGGHARANRTMVAEPVNVTADGKSVNLTAQGGGMGAKTGLYAVPVESEELVPYVQRKIGEIVDKYGYLPERFNPYNCSEITDKSPTLTAAMCRQTSSASVFSVIASDGKTHPVYEVRNGLITIKDKQYPIKLTDGYYIIRKLTVSECKRLQTVPDWYDFSVISNSQAYKCLGNGWTVDVIAHILKSLQQIL